jgi:hypothetical protein
MLTGWSNGPSSSCVVCLVHLVCFVYLVSFVQPKNQTDQTDQTTVFLCWWHFSTSCKERNQRWDSWINWDKQLAG